MHTCMHLWARGSLLTGSMRVTCMASHTAKILRQHAGFSRPRQPSERGTQWLMPTRSEPDEPDEPDGPATRNACRQMPTASGLPWTHTCRHVCPHGAWARPHPSPTRMHACMQVKGKGLMETFTLHVSGAGVGRPAGKMDTTPQTASCILAPAAAAACSASEGRRSCPPLTSACRTTMSEGVRE